MVPPFIWCSNNLLVDLILQIHLYEKMTGDYQFNAYKTNMRDWLFGPQPWGISMFMNIPSMDLIHMMYIPVRGRLHTGKYLAVWLMALFIILLTKNNWVLA